MKDPNAVKDAIKHDAEAVVRELIRAKGIDTVLHLAADTFDNPEPSIDLASSSPVARMWRTWSLELRSLADRGMDTRADGC